MSAKEKPDSFQADLALEVAELRRELAEAQETLEAIRCGGVDALVVSSPAGERVFTLEGAETPYRSLIEEINEGALLLRSDSTIVYANRRFAQLANVPLEQVIGSSWRRFFPEEQYPRIESLLRKARGGGLCEELPLVVQTADLRPVELSLSPLKGSQTISCIVTDLTERKLAEDALRQANERLEARVQQRTAELTRANESLCREMAERKHVEEARARLAAIVECSEDAIISKDLQGRITSWNAAAEQLFGYSADEVLGQPIDRIIPPECQAEQTAIVQGLFQSQPINHIESVRLAADGRRFPVSLTISPVRDAGGAIVGAATFVRDITQRKQVEAALREQAELTRLRADATQILQQPAPMPALLQSVAALVVERLDTAFARVWTLDQTEQVLELKASAGIYTHLDGAHSRVPVGQFKIGRIAAEHRAHVTNQVIGDPNVPGQDWARRERLVSFAGVPLLLEGRLLGVVAFFARHPISPAAVETFGAVAGVLAQAIGRKQAEEGLERKVQERTAELRETVAELEHFSYTITHDMRAPLRAMQGLAGILLEECAECVHPERRDYLRRIAGSADRMDRLITDALQYSGAVRQKLGLEPVDAGALLAGILESYPQFQNPQALIRIDNHLPVVLGNKAAMTQCFSNLLGNAVKFVQPGKTPKVRVWAEPRGEFTRFWFKDEGIGIDKQYQNKIWLMFQKLNKSYEGTGIGLALVAKVVNRMGGRVGVESEPGRGSQFWVELKQANHASRPGPIACDPLP